MSFHGPLSIAPVMDRIREQVTDLREVGGAANLEAAEKAKFQVAPAAYVLMGTSSAGQVVGSTQRFRQHMTARFAVLLALRDYKAATRGTGRASEFEQHIAAVRAALVGWAHPEANRSQMRMAGTGRVLKYTDAVLVWQDIFESDYRIVTP